MSIVSTLKIIALLSYFCMPVLIKMLEEADCYRQCCPGRLIGFTINCLSVYSVMNKHVTSVCELIIYRSIFQLFCFKVKDCLTLGNISACHNDYTITITIILKKVAFCLLFTVYKLGLLKVIFYCTFTFECDVVEMRYKVFISCCLG